jgi:hypothetical protein
MRYFVVSENCVSASKVPAKTAGMLTAPRATIRNRLEALKTLARRCASAQTLANLSSRISVYWVPHSGRRAKRCARRSEWRKLLIPCTCIHHRRRHCRSFSIFGNFPKLNVAGSSPVSRFIFLGTWPSPQSGAAPHALIFSQPESDQTWMW